MALGKKNLQAIFVRLMNQCLWDIQGVDTYIEDTVIYSHTWDKHLLNIGKVFDRLTINLRKSDFCQAEINYLGHVGNGKISSLSAKVQIILRYLIPYNVKGKISGNGGILPRIL